MVFRLALAAGILLLLLGALLMLRGVRLARLIQRLARLRPVPIAAAPPGLVMVRGQLAADPLLRSPYQGRACAYYFFRVVEPRPGHRPRTLATGKEWTLTRIEDATGHAQLDAVTAVVASPRRFETEFERLQKIPQELAGFFERAGIEQKHLERLPRFLVHEYTLEPGDSVYVTGTLRVEDGGKVFYRGKRGPLIVSSEPDIGYLRGLRNEFLIHAAAPPLLLVAGAVLLLLALA